jgi:hypothetical protein
MGYTDADCNSQLTAKNLLPCGGVNAQAPQQSPHCVDFNNGPGHLALCPDPNSPMIFWPISTYECFSPVLNQIFYRGLDTIASDCLNLMQTQPQNQWGTRPCFCCCSCFAYGTPIATPVGMRAVETIAKGDQVTVATAIDGAKLTWGTHQVMFSSGTGPDSSQPGMVHLRFNGDQVLVATADQVMMLEAGTLVQAGRVIPGTDRLLLADGSSAPIDEARMGTFALGVHHIATGLSWDNTIVGHLLNANGAVGGDYLLQLHLGSLPASALVPGHWDRPIIGTPEYQKLHTHVQTSPFHALAATAHDAPAAMATGFKPYLGRTRDMPDSAGSFFTVEQVGDIIANPAATKDPLSATMTFGLTAQLLKQINAFYPDVMFYIAWDDIDINAYAFHEYGHTIVYIAGGLLRLDALKIEGIAIVLLQQIGYFLGSDDPTGKTLATKGQADFWGVLVGARKILWPSAVFDILLKGIAQLQAVFGFVSAENAAGSGSDGSDPSLACRYLTFMNALGAGTLPACAGGPQPVALEVVDAAIAPTGVTITFNETLEDAAATKAGNYTLTPAETVTGAMLNATDAREVTLAVHLKPHTAYTIAVKNLTSVLGAALDPEHASTTFTTPAPAVAPR